jgi:hypothetical protein
VLYVLNVICPLLGLLIYLVYWDTLFFGSGTLTLLQEVALNFVINSIGVLQIISGVFLISSVFTIREFFKSKDASEVINTSNMILHAGAFGLYLLADVVYYIAMDLNVIWPENPQVVRFFDDACVFFIFANFMAQLLLVVIFWDLGRKELAVDDDDSAVNLVTGEFDEEAELQARIWN